MLSYIPLDVRRKTSIPLDRNIYTFQLKRIYLSFETYRCIESREYPPFPPSAEVLSARIKLLRLSASINNDSPTERLHVNRLVTIKRYIRSGCFLSFKDEGKKEKKKKL